MVTYTTSAKVSSLLQLGFTPSADTNPTDTEIEEVILRKEDEIDTATGHAWRTRFGGTTTDQATEAAYEYYDISYVYEYHTGSPVYLKHRKVKTFDANSDDVLEFWNGSEYEDWLSERTEGRNEDFWVDYERGILYSRAYLYAKKPNALRIKYRYGESLVPYDIEDICTKMSAIDLLVGMDPRANMVQEGSPVMSHSQRVDYWRREVDNKLLRYKEFKVVTGT